MKKQQHRSGNAHKFNRHRWCSAWVREMGELEVVRGQRVEPSQLLLRRSGSLLGSWQEARGFRVQERTARFPFLFSFLCHAMGSIGLWTGLDLYSVLYNLFCSWRFPWAQTFITLVASIFVFSFHGKCGGPGRLGGVKTWLPFFLVSFITSLVLSSILHL